MANTVADLIAKLTLDGGEFNSGISSVSGSLGKFTSLFTSSTAIIAAGSAVIAGIGAMALSAALDFDEASDTIRVGTGATGKALDDLNTSFSTVFTSVPATAADAATAIADLNTRLGLTGPALEATATQFLNLARITKTDLNTAIAAGTRLFGDWSIATEDQSAALDFMFKTSQSTGIALDRLMQLVVQFGAPLRAFGFSMEEGAALMGKWEKEGVNLETVLSGMRFALGKFAEAGKEPAAALQEVIAAIQNAKTESESTAIAFENFGQRAATDMSRAIIEGRFNIDELVTSLKASSETINDAAKDSLSLGERWKVVKNSAMALLEPIGKFLVGALEALVFVVGKSIDSLKLIGKSFDEWGKKIKDLIGWVAKLPGMDKIFGSFGKTVSVAASNIKELDTQQKAAEKSATSLTFRTSKTTEAAKALADWNRKAADSFKKASDEGWGLRETLSAIEGNTAAAKIETMMFATMAAAESFREGQGHVLAMNRALDEQAPSVAAVTVEMGLLTSSVDLLAQAGIDGITKFGTEIAKTPALIDQLNSAILTKASTDGKKAADAYSENWRSVERAVSQSVGNMVDILTGQREGSILTELKHLGINILEAFVNPFEDAINKLINGAIKSLMGWLTGPDGILGGLGSISQALGGVFGGGGSAVGSVAGSVGSGAGSIGGAAGSAGSSAAGLGGSLLSGGIAAAGGVAGGLITGFMLTGDLGKIEENTRGTKDQLVQGLQPKINEHLPKLDSISGYLWEHGHQLWVDASAALKDGIDPKLFDIRSILTTIRDDIAGWDSPVFAGAGGINIEFNNVNFRNREDVDYLMTEMDRKLREAIKI